MPTDPLILEGALSIQAALEASFRDIHQILIDESMRSDRRIGWLRRKARSAGASVSFVSRASIDAGADGAVVRPRNWTSATALVGRASAGASERLPLAIAENATEAAEFYGGHNLAIACAANTESAIPLYDADLTAPLFLLIGGERRGLGHRL